MKSSSHQQLRQRTAVGGFLSIFPRRILSTSLCPHISTQYLVVIATRSQIDSGCNRNRLVRRDPLGRCSKLKRRSSSSAGIGDSLLFEQVERDVDNHVFLPSNHLSSTQFDKNGAGIEAVFLGGFLCVSKETGIDSGVA